MILLGTAGLYLFLSHWASRPLWGVLPLGRFVQFPWRLGMAWSLLLALAAGGVPRLLPGRWRAPGVVALCLLAFLGANWWLYGTERSIELNDEWLVGKVERDYATTAAMNEYLPRWVPYFHPLDYAGGRPGGYAELVEGRGRVEVLEGGRSFRVLARTPVVLEWGHYYYPGWRARAEGGRLELRPSQAGLIRVRLEAGTHRLRFEHGGTPLRWAARGVSLLSLAVLALVLARGGRGRKESGLSVLTF